MSATWACNNYRRVPKEAGVTGLARHTFLYCRVPDGAKWIEIGVGYESGGAMNVTHEPSRVIHWFNVGRMYQDIQKEYPLAFIPGKYTNIYFGRDLPLWKNAEPLRDWPADFDGEAHSLRDLPLHLLINEIIELRDANFYADAWGEK